MRTYNSITAPYGRWTNREPMPLKWGRTFWLPVLVGAGAHGVLFMFVMYGFVTNAD